MSETQPIDSTLRELMKPVFYKMKQPWVLISFNVIIIHQDEYFDLRLEDVLKENKIGSKKTSELLDCSPTKLEPPILPEIGAVILFPKTKDENCLKDFVAAVEQGKIKLPNTWKDFSFYHVKSDQKIELQNRGPLTKPGIKIL